MRKRLSFGLVLGSWLLVQVSVAGEAQGFEQNTDRPGMDYKSFDLPEARPGMCWKACANEGKCKAWTYVKPGVQGPKARCWLKHGVPKARPADCCVSGVK